MYCSAEPGLLATAPGQTRSIITRDIRHIILPLEANSRTKLLSSTSWLGPSVQRQPNEHKGRLVSGDTYVPVSGTSHEKDGRGESPESDSNARETTLPRGCLAICGCDHVAQGTSGTHGRLELVEQHVVRQRYVTNRGSCGYRSFAALGWYCRSTAHRRRYGLAAMAKNEIAKIAYLGRVETLVLSGINIFGRSSPYTIPT